MTARRAAAARPARHRGAARGSAALALALAGLLAGCAAAPSGSSDTAEPGPLRIAAAASLAGAFDEIAAAFAARHPDIALAPLVYDGSATLATQILEGAPVDVFAAADEATLATVADAGWAETPVVFATNTLALIVPTGNPGAVTGLADLGDPDRTVVLCAPAVPCGAASERLLAAAGVTASVDSSEQSVTAVLAKVAAGEADAGLVYVTDAAADEAVATIPVPGADAVVNRYPIAALADTARPAAAAAFIAFVRGAAGQRILAEHGFGAP